MELKKYSYSVSTMTIWASFDFGEVLATSYENAKELARAEIEANFKKVNDALAANPETKGMTVECDSSQVEVKEVK
jgi:hypothetical protein